MTLRLAWLYPDQMNLYGDYGNILTLIRRAGWRGIELEVAEIGPGRPCDFGAVDIVFMGGGQDRGQLLIGEDLRSRAPELRAGAADGLGGLLVCGGYQLFGAYFQTAAGEKIEGLGILPAHTVAGPKRLIGNLVGELTLPLAPSSIVGFENHSGETFLEAGATPLAEVKRGYGNNATDRTEGLVHGGLIGTYCHGSLLPKNPHLADHLLEAALVRRYGRAELAPLDDTVELRAHHDAIARAETAQTLHI